MAKRLLSILLLLCLCAAGPAGCGEGSRPETDDALKETFEELLAADYEICYLFFSDGMTVDEGRREGDYLAVTAPYGTMDKLKKQLEKIYAKEETRKAILETKAADGAPLLLEKDGRLWRAASPGYQAPQYEVRPGSLRIGNRDEGTISFLFEETRLDGSLYETAMTMTRTSAGWRLAASRREAERRLVREGSDIPSVIPGDAARQTAEAFLSALLSGDAPRLEQLTGEPEGGVWARMKLTGADITRVEEELDSRGDYRVAAAVEDGAGLFPPGQQEFRLVVDWAYGSDEVIPVYFRPASEQYYNWRGYSLPATEADKAAERVESFIQLYQWRTFEDPWDLPPETVAEFSLLYARSADESQRFTPAEFAAAVEETFGITGFDGRGTGFYDKEQDRYLLWGRGTSQPRMLIRPARITGTRCQVEVTSYRDTLCTSPQRTLRYTLQKGDTGSWQLLSAQTVEE